MDGPDSLKDFMGQELQFFPSVSPELRDAEISLSGLSRVLSFAYEG
jgi:hypothetical protein